MPADGTGLSRRHMLAVLGTGAVFSTAGCAGDSDDDGDGGDDEDDTPDDDTSQNGDDHTSTENEPPKILDYEIEPTDFGTRLLVSLDGEDNQGIERAAISYGDLQIEETPGEQSFSIDGELTDIHEANLNETPGVVVFALEDVEGELTEETVHPHQSSPELSVATVSTATPGEVVVEIEADDEIGLHWLQIAANGETIEEIGVMRSDETDQELRLDPDSIADGEMNEVTTTVRNTFGNTQSETRNQYVREFEPLEKQEIEIGAVYMPFFGNIESWETCAVGEPEVGRYFIDEESVLNRHGDLMSGFGISRQQFDFVNQDYWRTLHRTRADTVLEQVPLEAMYVIGNSVRWRGEKTIEEEITDALETIRNEFFTQQNYARRDGRPIVKFWSITAVEYGGSELGQTLRDYVRNQHGDFEAFGDYLRDQLTVDGTDPYLIGGFRNTGRVYDEHGDVDWLEDRLALMDSFDAVSNWQLPEPGGTSLNADIAQLEADYRGFATLAEQKGIDFIPLVYAGHDDYGNECWADPDDPHSLPRGTEEFEDRFKLAEKYRDIDRIDIASFNDWGEGHMVEPGTYQGENYGTDLLKVVKEFAQGNA